MSIELVTTEQSKQKVEKKGGGETTTPQTKKEAPSLFDSLMQDVKKESTKSQEQTDISKQKVSSKDTIQNTTGELKTTNTTSGKHPVDTMVDTLVKIVVDEAQSKSTKKTKEDISKDTISKKISIGTTPNTKEIKVQKESVDINIKNKNLKKLSTNETKEKKKIDLVETIKKSEKLAKTEEIDTAKIIQEKTNTITKAVSDIEKEIKKTTTKSSQNNTKKTISTETKLIVKEKTNTITKAVSDINQEIDKTTHKSNQNNNLTKIEKTTKESIKTDTKKTISTETKLIVKEKTNTITKAISDINQEINKTSNSTKIDIPNDDEVIVLSSTEQQNINVDENTQEIIIVKTTLIESAVKDIKSAITKTTTVSTTQNIEISSAKTTIDPKVSLMATMFQTDQQKTKEKTSMGQVVKAKQNIEHNKTIDAVKKSANMLELDANNLELKSETPKSTQDNKSISSTVTQQNKQDNILNFAQNRTLNKIILDKQIETNTNIKNTQTKIATEQVETTQQIESKTKETNITVNVPQNVVETIQNKIIGAQQKVGNFMSDLARKMYLNYKPPVTAFKMNLNPANLGSISVVMKSNTKDSSISVNMNINNSSTLDTFTENKLALQNALQKQLGENSNISLNFNMQDNNSNNSFNQSEQDSSNKQNRAINQSETDIPIEETEVVENLDYM